jgi:hypothetical protein
MKCIEKALPIVVLLKQKEERKVDKGETHSQRSDSLATLVPRKSSDSTYGLSYTSMIPSEKLKETTSLRKGEKRDE